MDLFLRILTNIREKNLPLKIGREPGLINWPLPTLKRIVVTLKTVFNSLYFSR